MNFSGCSERGVGVYSSFSAQSLVMHQHTADYAIAYNSDEINHGK